MSLKFSEPLDVKFAPESADSSQEVGHFTGYANTWNKDRHGDVVQRGAFQDSINAMDAGQRNVPLLWQHDPNQPLGVIESAAEDDTGLLVTGHLVTGNATADRAYKLMKKGALSMSIGYKPIDFDPIPGGGALLKLVDLREISLVSVPSNAQSTILSVKALPELTRADWERMWSNGTLPPVGNRLSAVLAAACVSAISTKDASDDSEPHCERCAGIPDDAHIFSNDAFQRLLQKAVDVSEEVWSKYYEAEFLTRMKNIAAGRHWDDDGKNDDDGDSDRADRTKTKLNSRDMEQLQQSLEQLCASIKH